MSEFDLIPTKDYKAICDAIRVKDGSSGLIKSGEAANKINAIKTIKDNTTGTATTNDILSGKTAWVNGEQIIGTIKDGDLINFDGYAHATGSPIDQKYMDYLPEFTGTITISDFPAPSTATTKLNDDDTVLYEVDGQDAIIYSKDGGGVFAPVISASLFESYNANIIDLSNFDTSNVTDMHSMFDGCNSLTSLDVSNFDTSNVIDMSYMFGNCYSLVSLDLSSFNTSKVTDMSYMFAGCSSTILDLSNFDTSKVTNMSSMFYTSQVTTLDLSSFNTSKVTDMSYMFDGCTSLKTVYCHSQTDIDNFKETNPPSNINFVIK